MSPVFSTPADYARAVNLALALGVLVYAVIDWRFLLRVERSRILSRLALVAFTIASALASWETLIADSPAPGVRSFLFTMALCWVIASIIIDRHDRRT